MDLQKEIRERLVIGSVDNAKIPGNTGTILDCQSLDFDQHAHTGLQIHNPGYI
ncbi:MAG: hypothetical protein J7619_07535 [Dyadobacter sp.]|uniref:hypothetical protein n=1 Tax=Dyadobacter sp. TaxID=1914288 RepID=UPI001B171D74|nr:hypothetical protein [Dyadobacter sp.]MBO9612529.1 hypothetical protein [Dyadobacter sp.]